MSNASKQHPLGFRTKYATREEVLANPLGHIGRRGCWNRYKAFNLKDESAGSPHCFDPHHNTYGQIWTAIRYGLYCWNNMNFQTPRFILDLYTGEIVWQNYNKEDSSTYYYGNYGTNY